MLQLHLCTILQTPYHTQTCTILQPLYRTPTPSSPPVFATAKCCSIQKRGIIMRNTVEWTCEDVVHMDPSGEFLTVEQHCRDSKGRSAMMQLVGRRRDPELAKAMLQQA